MSNSKYLNDLFHHNNKEHSDAKTIIESHETLSKSQAIAFLTQASTTESRLSLLDAMKDTEEINELVPSSDSSSCNLSNTSSFDKLSYLSLCLPQQPQSLHMLNSYNNAAQSSPNHKKRSTILRTLFGRSSPKKKAIAGKKLKKNLQGKPQKRVISGGDQVKLSSTRINPSHEQYDPIPFASQPAVVQDQSLSSLSDPTSIRQHFHEQNRHIPSAQGITNIPSLISTNTDSEKLFFNADLYKYSPSTANGYYPKRVSAIEKLAKQYSPSISRSDGTGLLWYNANHQTIDGTTFFPDRVTAYKNKHPCDSSSDSRDTSSSSNSSSASTSTKVQTSRSSSSSSSTTTTTTSNSSSSTTSSSGSKQETSNTIGQYNRNQNDQDQIIRLDLSSVTSETSTSTSSSTSIQPCYQRSIARKQLSSTSTSSSSTNNNKYSRKVKRQRVQSNFI